MFILQKNVVILYYSWGHHCISEFIAKSIQIVKQGQHLTSKAKSYWNTLCSDLRTDLTTNKKHWNRHCNASWSVYTEKKSPKAYRRQQKDSVFRKPRKVFLHTGCAVKLTKHPLQKTIYQRWNSRLAKFSSAKSTRYKERKIQSKRQDIWPLVSEGLHRTSTEENSDHLFIVIYDCSHITSEKKKANDITFEEKENIHHVSTRTKTSSK